MSTLPSALPPALAGGISASAAWQQSTQADDVDLLAASQPNWALNYDQLTKGPFQGQMHSVQLPGVRLVHEQSNCGVRQRGHIGVGHYGFAMPLAMQGPVKFDGQSLDDQSIMVGRSEELDLCCPAGFGLVGIVVEADLLRELWQRMYQRPLSRSLDRQIVLQARPAPAADLKSAHVRMLQAIASSPQLLQNPQTVAQMRDEILMQWVEAIPERIEMSGTRSLEARKRLVERACELVMSRPEQPLSMLMLCTEIGTSQRRLEYCFQAVLGMSPSKYLRAARLNGVRRELKRAAQSPDSAKPGVQEVASRWGFWHMGEFAAEYRRQFGELPSGTAAGVSRRGG
jgi:AraC family transcriptional regulator, ethanolamine operon transcriptional activator